MGEALKKLNNYLNKTWTNLEDLEINIPYKIIRALKFPSKFHADTLQTVVHLDNGYVVALPSRYNDIDEDILAILNQGVNIINRGREGNTWAINFSM